MTETDEPDPLWWFDQLLLDDRVDLLEDPFRSLPPHLVDRFARSPKMLGAGHAYWVKEDMGSSPGGPSLGTVPANRLEDYRHQLDYWWSNLKAAEREYLIGHRADDELDGEYADKVQAVTNLPLQPENPLVVIVVRDNRTGRFGLPAIMRTYLELKAR
ncbi:MAG: hypothetical protein QOE89_3430 [Pseudonocardiales bacterium]|nr:hypothetical protein [Pseudonocardiales bacterium]